LHTGCPGGPAPSELPSFARLCLANDCFRYSSRAPRQIALRSWRTARRAVKNRRAVGIVRRSLVIELSLGLRISYTIRDTCPTPVKSRQRGRNWRPNALATSAPDRPLRRKPTRPTEPDRAEVGFCVSTRAVCRLGPVRHGRMTSGRRLSLGMKAKMQANAIVNTHDFAST
jgi:hypothetical protein